MGAPTESAPELGSADASVTRLRRRGEMNFILKKVMEELQWFCGWFLWLDRYKSMGCC